MSRTGKIFEVSRIHRWIPWSFLALFVLAACVGVASNGTAGQESGFWHERPAGESKAAPARLEGLPSLASLVKKLKPAVVNIYTTQVIKPKVMGKQQQVPPMFKDPFMKKFFGERNPFGNFERFFGVPRGELKRNSLGSGFILSPDGYVMTNHHVVQNASEIKVRFSDDKTLEAKVVGGDQKTDIALLKVEPEKKLPYVYLGDSDEIAVGDWVIAIGNPFGLGHTVTTGILSGKDRVIGHGPYDDFLQTDASINPGNSGGPLFDDRGNVVGVNTAIVAGGSGVGFAVPINLAKSLLPQLRTEGKVTRGWLGVGIQEMTEELAENFGVAKDSGVLVAQVFEDSPAEKAGIQSGDIILSVNGEEVSELRHLTTKIASIPPGSEARIELLRDGDQKTVTVELGERSSGEKLARGEKPGQTGEIDLGLTLVPLDPALARRLGVDEDLQGLVVKEVDSQSPAAGILRPRDIILEVNRRKVKSLSDLKQALGGKKESLLMRIQRGDSRIFVVIER